MTSRIHLVLAEEEKARLERAARREGMSLSAWLREAAREKLEGAGPPSLTTVGEMKAFFTECDQQEEGREPDWDAHRKVIEASRGAGVPDS
jgi:hypothetical protein